MSKQETLAQVLKDEATAVVETAGKIVQKACESEPEKQEIEMLDAIVRLRQASRALNA